MAIFILFHEIKIYDILKDYSEFFQTYKTFEEESGLKFGPKIGGGAFGNVYKIQENKTYK